MTRKTVKLVLAILMLSHFFAAVVQAAQLPIKVDMEKFNSKTLPGAHSSTRENFCLNGIWDFCPIFDKKALNGPALEKLPPVPGNSEWKKFRVPAKWKRISGTQTAIDYDIPKKWCKAGRAWYRRCFNVPESMKGKKIKLEFGGVLVYCEVFLNGESIGRNYCGVLPFEFDITDKVKLDGPNELKLYVTNQDALYVKKPKSRYNFTSRAPLYYGYRQNSAGIWRDVFLKAEPHVAVKDVFVITSVRKKHITSKTTILNSGGEAVEIEARAVVETIDGKPIKSLGSQRISLSPGKCADTKFSSDWKAPKLWSPETPSLYRLHTTLFADGTLVDEHFQRFGFREFWIDGKSFVLNGNKITLTGDWIGFRPGNCDAWLRPEYVRLKVKMFKKANYCGTRFNMAPSYILDICDELGFPIIATGLSDGPSFFDPEYFEEGMKNAVSETARWIKRDRNHPCVLIWSTENEDEYPAKENIAEMYREIDRAVTRVDPTRPFMHDGNTHSGNGDFKGWAPIQNFHYTGNRISLGRQLEQFVKWGGIATKPRVEGEISNYESEFSGFGGMYRLIGDKAWRSPSEVYKGFDHWARLQAGAWRACGLSGFMLFGNQLGLFNSPINATFPGWNERVLKFDWKDLSTPYPKPQYLIRSNMDFVNPWTPKAPKVITTPLFDTIRNVYNPVMVTLSRDIAHSYWSGAEMHKKAYAINVALGALENAEFKWTVCNKSGKKIKSGIMPCKVAQGEAKELDISVKLPACVKRTEFKLSVELFNDGKALSSDWMDIAVYPRVSDKLKLSAAPILLYDSKGATEKLLNSLGLEHCKIDAKALEALPQNAFLIVGCHAADADLLARSDKIESFIKNGGRALIMEQKETPSYSRSAAFVRAPKHPVFKGLPKDRLYFWRTGSFEMCASAIYTNPAGRQIPLVETVGNDVNWTYSDYVSVMTEIPSGKGRVLLCNLNVSEACEKGDPEGVIMFRNLLRYSASPVDLKRPEIRYVGDSKCKKFFEASLYANDMQIANEKNWADGIGEGDILFVGAGVKVRQLMEQKQNLASFVKSGGIVVCSADWKSGAVEWTPSPLQVRKLPVQIGTPWDISLGAFHLWKYSNERLFDGLGDLFLLESRRAKKYYIGDPIPGLEYAFAKPASPWENAFEIVTKATCSYKGLRRRHFYGSDKDAAVVTLKYGKGLFVLSTLPMQKGTLPRHFYGAVLSNLNAPSKKSQPLLAFSSFTANLSLKPANKKTWRKFASIDLIPYANRNFMDKEPGDKLGGWDDCGENDMRNLPTGDYVMCKVPFHIIDVNKDDPNGDRGIKLGHAVKACIVLKGEKRQYFPEKIKGIAVGKKARKIHFLHTQTWSGNKKREKIAAYIVNYDDGTKLEIPVRNLVEIADWWKVDRAVLKRAQVAWKGSNPIHSPVGLYKMTVYNPHKDKKIESIDFVSEGKSVPILLAITLQK